MSLSDFIPKTFIIRIQPSLALPVMMSFMMEMVPWFYAGLRILCVLLLFHISWEAYRLKSLE